ncbi:MAG: hypothetical protein OXE93_07885 [bacterium]|nr:hypothetical protein [bacterium]
MVELGATPMLIILILTSMNNKVILLSSLYVGLLLLGLGIMAAHSEGSLTWAAYHFWTWIIGTGGAIGIWAYCNSQSESSIQLPSPPQIIQRPAQDITLLLGSFRQKLFHLFGGAFIGAVLAGLIVYGADNSPSRWGYDKITLDDFSLLVLRWIVAIATPVILLLSQLKMTRLQINIWSIVVSIFILVVGLVYGQFDSLLGHYRLGYYGLWIVGIVAAFVAVKLQKQRIRKLSLF